MLQDYDFILQHIPGKANTLANILSRRYDHILLEIDRLVTLYSFVEQGSAAAIVSDTLVQYLQSGGKKVVFYRIDSEHAVRALYLSYKRNRYYSKPMEAFAKLIQELK
jgi:DNA-binding transcriptional LysR family regulator